MLNLETILAVSPQTKKVTVDAWGGDVLIRKLSVAQRDELSQYFGSEDKEDIQKACIYTITEGTVNEDGTPLFDREEHFDFLLTQDAQSLESLFGDILSYNGMAADSDAVKS